MSSPNPKIFYGNFQLGRFPFSVIVFELHIDNDNDRQSALL